MHPLPVHPILYEISTQVWLNQLSQKHQRPVTLGNIPDDEWRKLEGMGIDIVWLMGVWERSPMAVQMVRNNPIAIREFKEMLPDFQIKDLIGSPYSIHRYTVDPRMGGREGLAVERNKLAQHGMRLMLDYVPNHIAPDHPWTKDHPQYFIRGNEDDLERDRESFIQIGQQVYARGRDPNFAAWMDTVQLNAFHPELREATRQTLYDILSQCDGVRVDMAMLFLNQVFNGTWGERAGEYPSQEFWQEVIPAVKQQFPQALFMAEAYWDTERELHSLGFDYCYDKLLYDFIRDEHFSSLADHLHEDPAYQHQLVRFIENHDERRALTAFPDGHWKAAALTCATLPGLRMFYQGQMEGRRSRVSVLLGRWPDEPENLETKEYYQALFHLISQPVLKNGDWQQLRVRSERTAPLKRCAAWMWSSAVERYLVVVNFGRYPADVYIHVPHSNSPIQSLLVEHWTGEELYPSLFHDDMEIFRLSLEAWDARVYHWDSGG